MTTALWVIRTEEGPRLARGPVRTGPVEFIEGDLDAALAGSREQFEDLLNAPETGKVPQGAALAPPIGTQEVWASGVTYLRSRDARMLESDAPDFYDRVYDAERPELFFKATAERVRGPGEAIGIRSDSGWDVPEPELAVVTNASGEIVAYTTGNDVSSRSIEGENPLYLPQAKSYTGSCALGPCLVPISQAPPFENLRIHISIQRDSKPVYEDSVAATQMKRHPSELVEWLYRAIEFPRGAVLMTGTALVPDDSITLQPGDRVAISIDGLGTLENHVEYTDVRIATPRAVTA